MHEPIELEYRDEEVQAMLAGIIRRLGSAEPAMQEVGEILLESIQRNFEEGGRPTPWQELAPSTIKQRRRLNRWPGRILVRQGTAGGLLGAISYEAASDRVVLVAGKVYAAIQNLGGEAGRGHKVTIPAREYMMVQDEDWTEVKTAFEGYVVLGA